MHCLFFPLPYPSHIQAVEAEVVLDRVDRVTTSDKILEQYREDQHGPYANSFFLLFFS